MRRKIQSMGAIWVGFGLVCLVVLLVLFIPQSRMNSEIKRLSAVPLPDADRIVGSWYFQTNWSRPFRITLYRENGKLFEQTDYSDAKPKSVHEMELAPSGEITFKPLKYLQYTRINESGNLEMHFREDGHVEVGKPISYYQ